MAEASLNITDADLLKQLQESYIDPNQIKELEPLIPEMTNEERQELLGLIQRSNAEGEKVEKKYQENLGKLNKEYKGKMDKLSKEKNEEALKTMETIDQKGLTSELKEYESEIAAMPANAKKTVVQAKPKKKGHPVRNLFLILFFLILIAGGILYALSTLGAL